MPALASPRRHLRHPPNRPRRGRPCACPGVAPAPLPPLPNPSGGGRPCACPRVPLCSPNPDLRPASNPSPSLKPPQIPVQTALPACGPAASATMNPPPLPLHHRRTDKTTDMNTAYKPRSSPPCPKKHNQPGRLKPHTVRAAFKLERWQTPPARLDRVQHETPHESHKLEGLKPELGL